MNGELHPQHSEREVLPKFQNRPLRRKILILLSACALFVLFVLNLRYPVLSFTFEPLNDASFVAAAFLPAFVAFGILRLSSACTRKWIRAAIQTLSALLVIGTVLFGIIALVVGANSRLIIRTRLRTNAYAVTAYVDGDGIEVYQEKALLPGIALVRRLDFIPDADSPNIESIDKDHARVTLTIYEEERPKTREDVRVYDLKPFVYF